MGAISDNSYKKWGYGTGTDQIDLATQNRINNPYGNHTLLGVTLSTLLPQLISGGAEKLAAKGTREEEATETTPDVSEQSNSLKNFAPALKNYDNAVKANKTEDIKKYGKELQEIAEQYPDNKTIQNAYLSRKTAIEEALKK